MRKQRLREPVTLSCPLTEIEGCNQIGYSDRCQNCRTAQDFIEACPFYDKHLEEEAEEAQREQVSDLWQQAAKKVDTVFNDNFFQELIMGFLTGEIDNILYEEDDGRTKIEISQLTDDELIRLQTLVQLQERIDDRDDQTITVIKHAQAETNDKIRQFLEQYIGGIV